MKFITRMKNRIALKLKSKTLQNTAQEYWSKCDNSFIGAEELYINQEKIVLEHFVPKLNASDDVLDVGCCDGRFSFLISNYCRHVDGFDLSGNLIEKAVNTSINEGIDNVTFRVQKIQHLDPEQKYDHIMCMGVFTAIPDDAIVLESIKKICKMVKNGGYILLKDSLASEESCCYENEDYAAIYRNESYYKSLFLKYGVSIEFEHVLYSTMMNNQTVASKIIVMRAN